MPCKAKKFQDRMSHRRSGKAVGETRVAKGLRGMAVGEKGAKGPDLSAASYRYKQSSDGNGGK
jgi:hypothetical protein